MGEKGISLREDGKQQQKLEDPRGKCSAALEGSSRRSESDHRGYGIELESWKFIPWAE